jgi:hypothetical protein
MDSIGDGLAIDFPIKLQPLSIPVMEPEDL